MTSNSFTKVWHHFQIELFEPHLETKRNSQPFWILSIERLPSQAICGYATHPLLEFVNPLSKCLVPGKRSIPLTLMPPLTRDAAIPAIFAQRISWLHQDPTSLQSSRAVPSAQLGFNRGKSWYGQFVFRRNGWALFEDRYGATKRVMLEKTLHVCMCHQYMSFWTFVIVKYVEYEHDMVAYMTEIKLVQ